MWADVDIFEDTTTLFVRWEIQHESSENDRLYRLGGPLALRIEVSQYVDAGGAFHERGQVDVPIYPHPGRRNVGQAKFRDVEARRRFAENLQDAINTDVTDFLWEQPLEEVSADGHVLLRAEKPLGTEPEQ